MFLLLNMVLHCHQNLHVSQPYSSQSHFLVSIFRTYDLIAHAIFWEKSKLSLWEQSSLSLENWGIVAYDPPGYLSHFNFNLNSSFGLILNPYQWLLLLELPPSLCTVSSQVGLYPYFLVQSTISQACMYNSVTGGLRRTKNSLEFNVEHRCSFIYWFISLIFINYLSCAGTTQDCGDTIVNKVLKSWLL